MPFFASPSKTSLATRGPVVERSTNTFALLPSITPLLPSATAFTISGVGRLTSTVSHCDATSAGDLARFAPRCSSRCIAVSLVSKIVSA